MFRKVTLTALVVSLGILAYALWASQMTLSLNIGSGPVTLVQNGPLINSLTATLSAPSTAGTTLIAVVANANITGGVPVSVTSAPAGWVFVASGTEATGSKIEVWYLRVNSGSFSSFPFTLGMVAGQSYLYASHVSEWSNVAMLSTLEASGSASATSGTTLAPTTGTNVLTAGDLALSAWYQGTAAAGTPTFTTPGGWTRLADNGSTNGNAHMDIEYKINPATGAPLGPTLTSSATTATAAGVIVVLKAAPPIADQSAYLVYGSINLRLNTLDLVLVDCPTTQQPMSTVTLSDPGNYPDWTGTVGQVQARDVVDIRSGHHFQVITATNTQAPNFTGAPFNLSDNPATNTADIWLLENGDTWALENGTGSWLMESSVQENSYNSLSIGSQVGATSPAVTLTTLGNLTVPASREQPNAVNLWPGMTFKLTSSNLANWITAPGQLYTIQTITITYQGANPPLPVFDVQFGIAVDTATAAAIAAGSPVATWGGLFGRTQTLAEWTKAHAT